MGDINFNNTLDLTEHSQNIIISNTRRISFRMLNFTGNTWPTSRFHSFFS